MNKLLKIAALFSAIISISFFTSCSKNKLCKASVFVIDSEGAPLAGANVRVYNDEVSAETNEISNVLEEKVTNKTGRIDFERPLPATLYLVIDYAGYVDTKPGLRTIKFKEDGTSFVTVEMKQ